MSLLNIYPKNLGSLNPSEYNKKDEFASFYKRIGQLPKKTIELDWYEPGEAEIEYASYLYNLFIVRNIDYLKEMYPNETQYDETTMSDLVDLMHLNHLEISVVQKRDTYRIITLIFNVFSSISQRCSYKDITELNEIQKNFEKKFTLTLFANLRLEILNLIKKLVPQLIKNGLINDINTIKIIINLISNACGEDDHNDLMLAINSFLKTYSKAFSVPGKRAYDNRFMLATKYISLI